ncbi:MAG: hypothetical protein Q7K45_00510 [Nanoarchaeota archaeon]|nr:hypothetical protein [Nanoarchaeota archaeon]
MEVVKIEKSLSATDNFNYGELLRDERGVNVRNSLFYEGRSCLVRFDLRDGLHRQEPEGYFISSVVPPTFEGLAAQQYILVGLWDRAYSSAEIPTIQDIEMVYKPGNMPFLHYFQNGSSQNWGNFIIDNQKIISDNGSTLSYKIRHINPLRASRVFIMESETYLEKVMAVAKSQRIHPIIMEPFKK